MKEIINKPWNYSFFEDNNNYFLCVLCGGSALFEINLKLKDEEITLFKTYGEDYIANFAKNIQDNPSKYSDRDITV